MMKKRVLALAACVFGMTLFGLVGCGDGENQTKYAEENGGTPGGVTNVFSPDGVLNDEVYSSVRWLNNYTLDRETLPQDIDRVKTLAAAAAQLNMTVFFRDSGMYAAIDVTNEAGKAAYVNDGRDEALNSGVELMLKGYKVKLSPAGKFAWEKETDGAWAAYTEAESSVLGVQAKTAPLNEAGNTGYSMEFFVPAANLSAMGMDAAALARGGETAEMDAVLVTSYGFNDTAAARWELSSLLAWDEDLAFGKDGAAVYDISVELKGEKGASTVAEALLRDYTLPYDDTTFLIKEAEGYKLKSFTINGVAYDVEYLQNGFEKGKVTLRTDEVTSDLAVVAEFEKNLPASFEAEVSAMRFGTRTALKDVEVTFAGEGQISTFAVQDGKIEGRLPRGVYTVTVSDGLYDPATVAFDGERMGRVDLTYRAFASDKFGDGYGGYHDYTRVNRSSGIIENIDGHSFYPITNETFGTSAFTATLKRSQMSKESRLGLRYIWDEKTNGKGMRNAVIAELQVSGGTLTAGWADYTDNWNNYNVAYESRQKSALPAAFYEAFNSNTGVSLTLVRDGSNFDLFAEIAGEPASRLFVMRYTLDAETYSTIADMDGHWAVFIWDTQNGAEVAVKLSEDTSAWKQYTITDESESEKGSVTFGENIAVGTPVTLTFTPAEGYTLLSVAINGTDYTAQVKGNTLTLSGNVPLTMNVKAEFGFENYTANISLTGTAATMLSQDDLTVAFINGAGETFYARHKGEGVWKTSLEDGQYTYSVSAFGGGVLQSGTVTVEGEGALSVPLSNVRLSLSDKREGDRSDLLGGLDDLDQFVYTGFMGIEDAVLGDVTNFAAETKLHFADGNTMEIQFVKWSTSLQTPTYELKFMLNDDSKETEVKGNVSFMLTAERAPKVSERVLKDNGVWFAISANNGTVSVWAKNSDDEWEQLKTWDQNTTWGSALHGAVTKIEFRQRYTDQSSVAVLKDAQLWLGETISDPSELQ